MPEKKLGIDKTLDTEFARTRGMSTITTHFRGPFGSLPRLSVPCVIKLTTSSGTRGAFYVYPDRLFSISRSVSVSTWADLQALAQEELESTDLDSVEWEVQALVELEGLPAPDLKFYAFYGEIGTVLEASRFPESVYAYFDGSLNPIDFRLDHKPHFEDIDRTSVRRGLLTEEKMARVRELSLSIPVPFMRMDFLHSDDDLVFCEFSAAPGMSHCLTPEHDERLGRLYAEAEVRLVNDLLAGKSFGSAR
ncbi:ATP-grasp fold amidoligase family protein [Nostocoides sp. F2B08]|uniref:ATP-grasp fold amidoligase family protein n=1 Tax=Nostocoides sp. F2B08 TaxID=2653936 RepID=UPI00186B0D78|nr:ATP-grasp fold amidoligase family protein [Tetrasphaera sp. F2B08]